MPVSQLEDRLWHPASIVDASATKNLNQGVTLTFDHRPPESNQVISGVSEYSLSVLSKLLKQVTRSDWTNRAVDWQKGQPLKTKCL